jgi:hypothetical protein
LPDEVFNAILVEGQQTREALFKDRERQLQAESSALRRHHEAALREREHTLAAAIAREHELQEQTSALVAERARLVTASPWTKPSYWSPQPKAPRRWKVVPVASGELAALGNVLAPGGALGGRDQRLRGGHSGFRLGAAWRIENQALFTKYAVEKERLKANIAALPKVTPKLKIREAFWNATRGLPAELESDVNEVYLSHGTKPEAVLSVISGGLNERFSGGLFGHGTYFAEDVAKNDQYVTADAASGSFPELHKELYAPPRSFWESMGVGGCNPSSPPLPAHPGQVFYVFVCRVALGHFCRTQDARKELDTGSGLWSSEKRELAPITGTSPPEPYHALVAETGGTIQRFREFVTFHGDRVYPEYLLAYQRV